MNAYDHDEVVREVKFLKHADRNAYNVPREVWTWSKNSKIITHTSQHFKLHQIRDPKRPGGGWAGWVAGGQVDGMPIEFEGEIKYELFEDEVIISPTVPRSMASFFQTLLNVLEKAESLGLSKKDLARWLLLFVKEHYPEAYDSMDFYSINDNADRYWRKILGKISYVPQED